MRTRVEVREKITLFFTNSNKTQEEILGKNFIMELVPGQVPQELKVQIGYHAFKTFKLSEAYFELKDPRSNNEVQYVVRYTLESKKAFNYNDDEKSRFLHSYCGEMGFMDERSLGN